MVERDPEWAGWCGMLVDRARPRRDGRGADRRAGHRRRARHGPRRGDPARREGGSGGVRPADPRRPHAPRRSRRAVRDRLRPHRPSRRGERRAPRRPAARVRGPHRRLAPGLHGPPVGLDLRPLPRRSSRRCSAPCGGPSPAPPRTSRWRASSARSGCSRRRVAPARRSTSPPSRAPTRQLADWLTCFPGFAVVAAGNAPTSPETVTARCGTLTAEPGVRLRWPDGELTTALASAPTGLGRAC